MHGTRSVYAERVTQGYFTDIQIDRDAIARYGLTVEDVQDVIQTAIGGENVTRTVEGRERYPVNVRYAARLPRRHRGARARAGADAGGQQVPLGQLAHIVAHAGPGDDSRRGRAARRLRVRGHATARSRRICGAGAGRGRATGLTLPQGYTLDWTGQYEFQVRARERLRILLPVVFACILCCCT